MLKKLSIAGLAVLASSGIAFADTSDMSGTDTSAMSDNSANDASMNNAASDNSAVSSNASTSKAAHKKHKKHKKHYYKKHHHVKPAPVAETDAAPAPKADYKGEVAAPCPANVCPNPFMGGAYLGFSVASRVNYTSSPAVYNGLEGTLLGGYGWLWDQWYAALEIFVQDSTQITNNTSSVGSAKSSWGYGLSILPGYMLVDNVLGYLRLGIVETRFSTRSSNLLGGQIGLGLDTALCNNWDLRAEYVYSFYNSISNHGGNPKSQQFNLGLVYKFQM